MSKVSKVLSKELRGNLVVAAAVSQSLINQLLQLHLQTLLMAVAIIVVEMNQTRFPSKILTIIGAMNISDMHITDV